MNEISNADLLARMRLLTDQVGTDALAGRITGGRQGTDTASAFASLMQSSIATVNENGQRSAAIQKAFAEGTAGVDPLDVVLAMQKASLSFLSLIHI